MNHDENERLVFDLMHALQPRPQPSAVAREAAHRAARRRWRELVASRRSSPARALRPWALAALAAAVAGLVVWIGVSHDAPPATDFGEVAYYEGGARATAEDGHGRTLARGSVLATGTNVATGEGRVAIAVPGGLSLRVDRQSRVRIDAADQVTLLAGGLYIDSGQPATSPRLRVLSPAGVIEHVGTQYQVGVRDGTTLVAVREGVLRVVPGDDAGERKAILVPHGRALRFPSQGDPVWSSVASHDASWSWAAAAAPPFEIEGRAVSAFLDWVCREQGWSWTAAGALARADLERVLLHGSIAGLDVRESLEQVAAVADVRIEVDFGAGTLVVREGYTPAGRT